MISKDLLPADVGVNFIVIFSVASLSIEVVDGVMVIDSAHELISDSDVVKSPVISLLVIDAVIVTSSPIFASESSVAVIVGAAKGSTYNDDINDDTVKNELWTAGMPDPDLIVRTGSRQEIRLSNFLLYQAAYSELLFLDCYWPEINNDKLQYCMDSFNKSVRNFGA